MISCEKSIWPTSSADPSVLPLARTMSICDDSRICSSRSKMRRWVKTHIGGIISYGNVQSESRPPDHSTVADTILTRHILLPLRSTSLPCLVALAVAASYLEVFSHPHPRSVGQAGNQSGETSVSSTHF